MEISKKYFRFNPADFGSTYHIVKNIFPGNVEPHTNGEVTIEYLYEDEITSLGFHMALHKPTPEDATPENWPRELRQRQAGFMFLSICKILMFLMWVIVLGSLFWEIIKLF
jgi:hypothetical protein